MLNGIPWNSAAALAEAGEEVQRATIWYFFERLGVLRGTAWADVAQADWEAERPMIPRRMGMVNVGYGSTGRCDRRRTEKDETI